MWDRVRTWLGILLFHATLVAAGALVLLVVFAPVIAREGDGRFLGVFAQDSTVRRTALASAAGLAVTAFAFFRPAQSGKKAKLRRPPPNTMAGA